MRSGGRGGGASLDERGTPRGARPTASDLAPGTRSTLAFDALPHGNGGHPVSATGRGPWRFPVPSAGGMRCAGRGVRPTSRSGGLHKPDLRAASASRVMPGLHHPRLAVSARRVLIPRDKVICDVSSISASLDGRQVRGTSRQAWHNGRYPGDSVMRDASYLRNSMGTPLTHVPKTRAARYIDGGLAPWYAT